MLRTLITPLKPGKLVRNFSMLPLSSYLPALPKIKQVLHKAKEGSKNIWKGCKLTYRDAKFFMNKKYAYTFQGEEYTIKTRKALQNTSADLLKMIPFSFFIVVPFAELLLPPSLYLFPDMIPSTFITEEKKEAAWKAMISQRTECVHKLHAYVTDVAKSENSLEHILNQIRFSPGSITREQLIKNQDLLGEYLKFGNMNTEQLLYTCKFLGFEPWTGFKTFNRAVMSLLSKILALANIHFPKEYEPKIFPLAQIKRDIVMIQLRRRINQIRIEDQDLLAEDFNTIEPALLKTLCRERGIESEESSDSKMRRSLKAWVRDSTYPSSKGLVPIEFLVFSQVFSYIPTSSNASQKYEQLPMTTFSVDDALRDSIGRLLQLDKREILHLLQSIEDHELDDMKESDKLRIANRLEQVLDDSIFYDQHLRIEENIRRLEEPLMKVRKLEGPIF